jgi:hypothetical protein
MKAKAFDGVVRSVAGMTHAQLDRLRAAIVVEKGKRYGVPPVQTAADRGRNVRVRVAG